MYLDEVENILESTTSKNRSKYDNNVKKISLKNNLNNSEQWMGAVKKIFKKYDNNIESNLQQKTQKIRDAYTGAERNNDNIIYKIAQKEIRNNINRKFTVSNPQQPLQMDILRKDTNGSENASKEISSQNKGLSFKEIGDILKNKESSPEQIRDALNKIKKYGNDWTKKYGAVSSRALLHAAKESSSYEEFKNKRDEEFDSLKKIVDFNNEASAKKFIRYIWQDTGKNFFLELPVGSITVNGLNAFDGVLKYDNVFYPVEAKNTSEESNTNTYLGNYINKMNTIMRTTSGKTFKIGAPIILDDSGLQYNRVKVNEGMKNINDLTSNELKDYVLHHLKSLDKYTSNSEEMNKAVINLKNYRNDFLNKFNEGRGVSDSARNLKGALNNYLFLLSPNKRKSKLEDKKRKSDIFKQYTTSEFLDFCKSNKIDIIKNMASKEETEKLLNFLNKNIKYKAGSKKDKDIFYYNK